MARIEILKDIPESEVDFVVLDLESSFVQVEKFKQDNGLWTIKVTYEIDPDEAWGRE